MRYIHNNPVKANICKKANEYKYSSCYNNIFYTGTELEKNIKQNMYVLEIKDSHKKEEEKFILIENDENKEQIANDTLKEFIIENGITKEELCKNKKLITIVVKKLKNENGISYRMMENLLGINRKKLKRIEEMQNDI